MFNFRRLLPLLTVALLSGPLSIPAEAFWGFGPGGNAVGSGLDLTQGYDRNTVLTLEGRVAASPDPAADPVTVEMNAGSARIVVVLGPRWYLQHDNLDWKAGDSISVRGSKAQGKDGLTYLLAEWVVGPSGRQMVLRAATGRPAWAGGFRGQQGGAGQGQQRGDMGGRKGR
jgi:hypothetical protein